MIKKKGFVSSSLARRKFFAWRLLDGLCGSDSQPVTYPIHSMSCSTSSCEASHDDDRNSIVYEIGYEI